jgi:hypothetical protein
MIDEQYVIGMSQQIGVDRIFWECDYSTRAVSGLALNRLVDDLLKAVPEDEVRKIENAEHIFRWEAPEPTADLDSLIHHNVITFAWTGRRLSERHHPTVQEQKSRCTVSTQQ